VWVRERIARVRERVARERERIARGMARLRAAAAAARATVRGLAWAQRRGSTCRRKKKPANNETNA
jgi:hypothetical protein